MHSATPGNPERILFLCSCLEPGVDEGGTYSTAIATACQEAGIQSVVIALFDPFVNEVLCLNSHTLIFRIPKQFSDAQRLKAVLEFKTQFLPDWISIQVTPSLYHSKGLLSNHISLFRSIAQHTPVHIVVDELWTGLEKNSSVKEKVWGMLQRYSLTNFLKKIRPATISTPLDIYLKYLNKAGIKASGCTVPGSIQFTENNNDYWLLEAIEDILPDFSYNNINSYIFFALPGSLKGCDLKSLFEKIRKDFFLRTKKVVILSVAATSADQEIWNGWIDANPDFRFVAIQQKQDIEISQLFQFAHFGIATAPIHLLGKFPLQLSMLEHGLPVFCQQSEESFSLDFAVREFILERTIISSEKPIDFSLITRHTPLSHMEQALNIFLDRNNSMAGSPASLSDKQF